ncbi:creatinine amidohydrolase [Sinosporangium album]|uniref:Creatinine amidohydrolase n=2 Tax=Sinosporangium album TaxID=504805 RepID=A0A1G8CN26_9ACTN|nr:creatinine amidohydrolase [Sinosporangium album]
MWELTTTEVGERIAAGCTTAVVVVGSTEQHGPHLPTFTDTYQAYAVGELFAHRIGALLAAPIPVGCADHHLSFPGTISLPEAVLIDVVEAYAASLFQSGFTRIVVCSTHGGNYGPLARGADRLRERLETPGRRVVVLSDLAAYARAYIAALRNAALPMVKLPHAEASETSVILAIRPDLVKMELAEPGFMGDVPRDRLIEEGLAAVAPTGVLGDPRGATAALGRDCMANVVDVLEAMLREAQ